jgi:hypothetical protein
VSVQLHEASIRPAAILPIDAATRIVAALEQLDVSRGGVWNATPGVWQRYDRPWDGPLGSRGSAELVGSIAVVYDRPRRNEITEPPRSDPFTAGIPRQRTLAEILNTDVRELLGRRR